MNVLTEAYVTDQGLIEGAAAELLRARRLIGAEHVAIFADVHVKHAAPLLPRPIRDSALDMVERGGADVLVVSGSRTGVRRGPGRRGGRERPRRRRRAGQRRDAGERPTMLGVADGAIVATAFRPGGDLSKRVDRSLVEALIDVVRGLRAATG